MLGTTILPHFLKYTKASSLLLNINHPLFFIIILSFQKPFVNNINQSILCKQCMKIILYGLHPKKIINIHRLSQVTPNGIHFSIWTIYNTKNPNRNHRFRFLWLRLPILIQLRTLSNFTHP